MCIAVDFENLASLCLTFVSSVDKSNLGLGSPPVQCLHLLYGTEQKRVLLPGKPKTFLAVWIYSLNGDRVFSA